MTPSEHNRYKARRGKKSQIGILGGFALSFLIGVISVGLGGSALIIFVSILIPIAYILILWGCYNWLQYKGQNGWWTLFATFSFPFGLLAIGVMLDLLPWATEGDNNSES